MNNIIEIKEFSSFEELFIWASELKHSCDYKQLKEMRKIIKEKYFHKFDGTIHLLDFLDLEIVYSREIKNSRENREKEMQDYICENFESIFPNFELVRKEFSIKNGRIDILAEDKESKRPVIIELKVDNKNPTVQLLGYAKHFVDPILIGITEKEISDSRMDDDVTYYIFKDNTLKKYMFN